MARGDVQVNNFVRGLITEASPLTFPQGASLDEVNFKLKKDGTRERRLGLDLETDYSYYDISSSTDILAKSRITAYRWTTPSGNADMEIGVVQIGKRLFFIDLLKPNPSAHILNGGMPLTSPAGGDDQIMNFATINNQLVAVSNALADPYLLTYDAETDVVHAETAPILVRDIWGVDDSIDVNYRPTTLSTAHHYNLLNQGWDPSIKTTCGDGINAIECTYNTFGVYPANSDHWSIGRVEDLTSADVWKYDAELASRNLINSGQVAKGHFIIPLFDRGLGRFQQTGLPVPLDRETRRISCVAAYAGRVFYSGIYSRLIEGDIRSPILSGSVLFSKPFFNKIDLVTCYQEADPTNPDINDIIDTDGGIIQIPECNLVVNLLATKESLFVLGYNGVWQIRGDEGGFRATSYQVLKVSDIGVYAPKSIIEANGAILFWGVGGIYSITPNQFGSYDTNNITLTTIQRLYNSIPDSSKVNVRGFFDRHSNTARWLHYSPETKVLGNPIDIYEVPPQSFFSVTVGNTITRSGVSHFDIVPYSNSRLLTSHLEISAASTIRSSIIDVNETIISSINTVTLTSAPNVVATSTDIDDVIIKFENGNILSSWSDNADPVKLHFVCSSLLGTVYSPGSVINPYTTASGSTKYKIRVEKLTETKLFCVFYDGNRPVSQTLKALVIDVSGTSLTPGVVFNITATGAQQYDIAKISETSILLIWKDDTLAECSKLLSISGTNITESATHQITGFSLDPLFSPIIHLKTSSSGYLHYCGQNKNRVRNFVLSGHQITVSSYLEISTNTLDAGDTLSSALIGDTLISTYITSSPRNSYLNVSRLFIPDSNQSITPKYDTNIDASITSGRTKIIPYGNNNYMVATRSTSNVLKFYTYKITL